MTARMRWLALAAAIGIGAAVGAAITLAQRDGGIFEGEELPTPTDVNQAEINALTNEAFGLLSLLELIGRGECPDGGCGIEATPADAFSMLLARCERAGFPDDTLRPSSDTARALVDGINLACGSVLQAEHNQTIPRSPEEFRNFASTATPLLAEAYERATGTSWPQTESEVEE